MYIYIYEQNRKKIDWQRANQKNERERYSHYRNGWLLIDDSISTLEISIKISQLAQQQQRSEYQEKISAREEALAVTAGVRHRR